MRTPAVIPTSLTGPPSPQPLPHRAYSRLATLIAAYLADSATWFYDRGYTTAGLIRVMWFAASDSISASYPYPPPYDYYHPVPAQLGLYYAQVNPSYFNTNGQRFKDYNTSFANPSAPPYSFGRCYAHFTPSTILSILFQQLVAGHLFCYDSHGN